MSILLNSIIIIIIIIEYIATLLILEKNSNHVGIIQLRFQNLRTI